MKPQHSVLFVKMGDKYLIVKIKADNSILNTVKIEGQTGDEVQQRLIPAYVMREYKRMLPKDGFRVETDVMHGHVAAFGEHDKRTIKQLVDTVLRLLPEDES